MANGDRQSARSGLGWKAVAGVSLAVLVGGLLLAGWIITHFDLWGSPSQQVTPTVAAENVTGISGEVKKTSAAAATKEVTAGESEVTTKLEQLEDRLSQLDVGGRGADGYSARADAVVTALSVRRAIERGAALGYTENQLRLRFGATHPQAVAAIQAAAQDPVTLTNLRDDMTRNRATMITEGDDDSLWSWFQSELASLFVLRNRGTPSTAPAQIMQRAEQAIANGDVRSAISDIEKLPANTAKTNWLADARRYLAARDALDTIERSALTAPSAVPAVTVTQPVAPAAENPSVAEPDNQ